MALFYKSSRAGGYETKEREEKKMLKNTHKYTSEERHNGESATTAKKKKNGIEELKERSFTGYSTRDTLSEGGAKHLVI